MKPDTKKKILDLLSLNSAQRPSDLATKLNISPQALHRHLKALLENKQIVRLGSPPQVLYKLAQAAREVNFSKLSEEQISFIENNFSELQATGELTRGQKAFQLWLIRTKQEKAYLSLVKSYIEQRTLADKFRDHDGFIDLLPKVKSTLANCCLDKVVCQDFYSLPQFGKTYLGNLLTASKSGQDRSSFQELLRLFSPFLKNFIIKYKIDAIAWVPHSIPRKLMVIDLIRKSLNLQIPEIETIKVFSGSIPVAQKSLSRLSDRIENARETIYLGSDDQGKFKRILIVDDALGSGATLNEVAIKIKKQYQPKEIYGMAIVGSYKGFDVISVI